MKEPENERKIEVIARIQNGFHSKFGIPRQSGLVEEVVSRIVFEKQYRDPNALRGLDGYSHLWLLWEFSENAGKPWSPTVKPPRLGGNTRMGVFATRSPFRPNPIGLSCVRLAELAYDKELGPVLFVAGADLMDGTPIYDIKPYLAFTDSHPDAACGFADTAGERALAVEFPEEFQKILGQERAAAVRGILAGDPRPAYQKDETRVYGVEYDGYDIRFRVAGNGLTVCGVVPLQGDFRQKP